MSTSKVKKVKIKNATTETAVTETVSMKKVKIKNATTEQEASEMVSQAMKDDSSIIVVMKDRLVLGYNASEKLVKASFNGIVHVWTATSDWLRTLSGQHFIEGIKALMSWIKDTVLAGISWIDTKVRAEKQKQDTTEHITIDVSDPSVVSV
jgi:hypothetical protein